MSPNKSVKHTKTHDVPFGSGIHMTEHICLSPQAKSEMLKARHKEIKSRAKRIFQEVLFDGCTFEKLEH